MHEIYSIITRQMILNIIKEMTSGINLASAKPVDLLVSITLQFLSFSLQFHFLHLFSLSFFQCIPLLLLVNLTCIIISMHDHWNSGSMHFYRLLMHEYRASTMHDGKIWTILLRPGNTNTLHVAWYNKKKLIPHIVHTRPSDIFALFRRNFGRPNV